MNRSGRATPHGRATTPTLKSVCVRLQECDPGIVQVNPQPRSKFVRLPCDQRSKIAKVDPYHLIFAIGAVTQHYADFEVQVRAILGEEDPFEGAAPFMETLYRKLLTP